MNRLRPLRTLCLCLALASLAWLAAGCGITTAVTDYFEYSNVDSGLRKRVTVSPFYSGIKELDPRARAWSAKLTENLKSSGGLTLVRFEQLAEGMRAVRIKGASAEERAIEAAKPLGINAIITGQFTDLGVRRRKTGIYGFRENTPFLTMEGELRIIEVATGTILGHRSFLAEKELSDVDATAMTMGKKAPAGDVDQLQAEIIQASLGWAGKNLGNMPWTGFVLEVDGERLRSTVGRDTGLPKGSGVVVYELGEKIKTGAGTEVYLPGAPVADAVITDLSPRTAWLKVTKMIPVGEGEDAAPATLKQGQLLRAR